MDPDPFLCSWMLSPIVGDTFYSFSTYSITLIVIGVLLLLLSGFVAAAERAFLSLSQTDINQIAERRSSSDIRMSRMLTDYGRVIATFHIAGTVSKVVIVVLGNFFFFEVFEYNTIFLSWLFYTLILVLSIHLLGETLPSMYASRNPLAYCRAASWGILALRSFFYPLTSLNIHFFEFVNKHVRAHRKMLVDDLSHALEISENNGHVAENQMLEGIIRFGGEAVKEVMTPRLDIVDLDIRTPFKDVLKCVVENVYSRIPVYAGSKDDIKGILYIKDLLPHLNKGDNFRWQSLIRPAYFVPETKMIDDLLNDFQKNRIHIAIVVDEFGGTSGLITMEDIIEEIVGEIRDEYDDEERTYSVIDDHTWVFLGKTLLTDFFRITEVDEHDFDNVVGDADTLAGLMLELKGEFPALHEVLSLKEYRFEILEMDNRRILKVKFTINNPATGEISAH